MTDSDFSRADWEKLSKPLRRYAPASALGDFDHDFKLEVSGVIALFKDQETPLRAWMERMELLIQALRADDKRLAASLEPLQPYVRTARRRAPQPGRAVEALHRVEVKAAALLQAITDAIRDPWLDAAIDAELLNRALMRKFEELVPGRTRLHSMFPEIPIEETQRPGGVSESFLHVSSELLRGREFVSAVRVAAERGRAVLERTQLRGRPSNARARLLALLLLSITRRYAPSPPPGRGVKVWRQATAKFVCELTTATGLPTVSQQLLEKSLRT